MLSAVRKAVNELAEIVNNVGPFEPDAEAVDSTNALADATVFTTTTTTTTTTVITNKAMKDGSDESKQMKDGSDESKKLKKDHIDESTKMNGVQISDHSTMIVHGKCGGMTFLELKESQDPGHMQYKKWIREHHTQVAYSDLQKLASYLRA